MIESTVYTMRKLQPVQKIYSKMHDRGKTCHLPSKFAKNRVTTIITVGNMVRPSSNKLFKYWPGVYYHNPNELWPAGTLGARGPITTYLAGLLVRGIPKQGQSIFWALCFRPRVPGSK